MIKFVFGTGIALVNNWKLIKENFNPDYCIDNNSDKWGKEDKYTGLQCISPDKLLDFENPQVLITIGDSYVVERVNEQLQSMGISPLILADFLSYWGSKETFPKHLQKLQYNSDKKRIVLFNTPEHDNIGDHLITLSEWKFLTERFHDYDIFEVTDIEYLWFKDRIIEYLKPEDIILITGGGFLGSLWLYNGENNVRSILSCFPNNRIVVLPQTIYFEENERGKREIVNSLDIYRKNQNVMFCLREQESYNFFQKDNILRGNSFLLPDMALFYSTVKEKLIRSNTILMCMRKDKERILSETDEEVIENYLKKLGWKIVKISMHSEIFSGIDGRMGQVENKLSEIGSASLVITDTLHCMISATITGTPCIAFDNLSRKVSNVYKWIEELPYVFLCHDVANFELYLEQMDYREYNYNSNYIDIFLDRLESIIRGGRYED